MKTFGFALLILPLVAAHGSEGHGAPIGSDDQRSYAERHMASEHHIDSFDLGSFFALHDLNQDGYWDKEEIEAIYGVHHVYSTKKSADEEEHKNKAEMVFKAVLRDMDKDNDEKITLEEFEAVGYDGLPDFSSVGIEGHHYDIESEFFLHHEEEFHNTPETQTDESYNHPEDIEHFAQHEAIERREAEKEAAYQGISVEEALASHEHQPADDHPEAGHPPDEHAEDGQNPTQQNTPNPKVTRVTPPEKQDPVVKFQDARAQMIHQDEWGTGYEGFKAPKSPVEKMRKNLPYKYKFRRSYQDF